MNFNEIKDCFKNRDVYLWGARQLGFSTLKVLEREGFKPAAFLDSSPDLQGRTVLGLPVLKPEEILARPAREIYVIITSGFYAEEISGVCREAGLSPVADFIAAAELQKFDYQIDVSGSCNLKCISCPRGNFSPQPKAGFMSPDDFAKVLDKILREDPLVGAVALYNWGEPLLNPKLPEIIRHCRERGVHSAVSSNLSFKLDFSEVVKAAPTWFRVSTSGFGPSYEVTHTGGRWDWVLENMRLLKKLRADYAPEMEVEVFHHIYKNRGEDYRRMKELCESLGFNLRVRHAALAPLDNIADIISGRPVNEAVAKTAALQSLSVAEAMARAREEKDLPCPYARCLWITWDLKISKCMEWFHPDLQLTEKNFLEAPIEEISAARMDSDFCRDCMRQAIHRCFIVYGDESLIEQRGSLAS